MCLGMVLSPITELIKLFKRDVGAITFYQVASLPGGSVSEDKLCCFQSCPIFGCLLAQVATGLLSEPISFRPPQHSSDSDTLALVTQNEIQATMFQPDD